MKGDATIAREIAAHEAQAGFAHGAGSLPLRTLLRIEQANQGPVAERLLYVGVPDIAAALARITTHGGQVVFPRTEVPGVFRIHTGARLPAVFRTSAILR